MKAQSFSDLSRVAIVGGVMGLIPFWVLAAADFWASGELLDAALRYLVNYAALILTFVGAIWWGIALAIPQKEITHRARSFLFAWSLLPCLLAWLVLMVSAPIALLCMAILLLVQLLMDFIFLWRVRLIPQWFWRLRVLLSIGAVPALLIAAV